MTPDIKTELKWVGIPLVGCLLFFGIITGFEFGISGYEFNGARLDIPTMEPFLMTYFWVTLIVFLVREWQQKFERKSPIIILLTYNSLAFITTILFMYTLFVASAVGGIVEIFISKSKSGEFQSPLLGILDYIKWGAIILLPSMIFIEFWLINRLKKLSLT